MIKLSVFLAMTLIFINIFSVYKKKTPILTLLLVWLVIEFLLTSFISVIVDNAKLWEINKNDHNFIIFRVSEVVIFPILMLIYVDVLHRVNSFRSQMVFSILWAPLLVCIEYVLVGIKIFKYANWHIGWSFLSWYTFLILIFIVQFFFNQLLKREGVLS